MRITSACNQRCPFCFVPLTGRGASSADIETKLRVLARQPGFPGELTISGGEPTLDARLPRILEIAGKMGFRRVSLQTNGVLLSKPGMVERLADLGVASFLVSFHSHIPRTYDRVTGTSGQYPRAVEGLRRLVGTQARGAKFNVTVNVVVNTWNYRHLPGLAGFLGRMGAALPKGRGLEMYFSMVNEVGHLKVPDWTIDLRRAAPFIRRAVERCGRSGLRISAFGGESGFPPCLLDDPERHAMRRELPQERIRYGEEFSGEASSVGRAKHPACRLCSYDDRCLGVPAPYGRLYGLGALRVPVDDGGRRP
ncbi:MAG: radical SAM protein [Elusimicrobiota bacterium]